MAEKGKSAPVVFITEDQVRVMIVDAVEGIGKLIAEAVKGFSTVQQTQDAIESVTRDLATKESLQKALDNLVSRETLNSITSELITKDQWNEALEGMLSTPVSLSGIHPGLLVESQVGELPIEPIPAEYLTGLVFRSSKPKKTDTGKVNLPTERPLTPADVLNWKDNGETVTIITADGQKYTADKE